MFAAICGLLIFAMGLATARLTGAFGRPMPVMLVVTGLTLALGGAGTLRISEVSPAAATVVLLVSATAVFVYALVLTLLPQGLSTAAGSLSSLRPANENRGRLLGLLLTAATVYGVYAFRTGIESYLDQPYDSLTLSQVRFIQAYEPGALSITASLISLGPLAAAVNYVSFRTTAWRVVGFAVPVALCFATPSRTLSLNAVVVAGSFVVVAHRLHLCHWPELLSVRPRFTVIMLGVGVAALGLWNFLSVGTGLNKISEQSSLSGLPPGIENLLLYLTGPWSAFSAAMSGAIGSPGSESSPRVYWLIWKVVSTLSGSSNGTSAPSTGVGIPMPFNTYSWVGDLVLSAGLVVAIAVSGAVGLLFALTERSLARRPSLGRVWANAVLIAVAANFFTGFRLLGWDTLLILIVGLAAFAVVGSRRAPKNESEFSAP